MTSTPSAPLDGAASVRRLPGERTDYLAGSLPDDAPADPLALFDIWLAEAFAQREEHADLPEPSAVVLATVALDADGTARPRSRTVLLKGHDRDGFVVFTNYDSDKGHEAEAMPRAALLLPWYPLQRQVRIEGTVEPVTAAESDAYWAQRPRGSQLGAWASHQSRPISSREALEAQYAEVEERFADTPVPRPPHWGGLRVRPTSLEFWQGRPHRFHDRILYTARADGGWERHRLQP